jgi:O-antigen ligase
VSILEPFRGALNGIRQPIVRYRAAIALEIGMVSLWLLLRMTVDVASDPFVAWAAAACAIALISPTSGLVILLATIPFYEQSEVAQALGLHHLFVGALGISVAIRLAAGRWRSMIWTAPVRLAIGIGAATALGVANTWRLFPTDWALHTTQYWLASVGGAMIIFLVGVWVASTGARRHIAVVLVSTTIAVSLALIELFAPGSISTSALHWIGFWKDFHGRLSGPIASPNGMAALAVMPACVLTALAVLGRRRTLRLLAAAGAAVLLVAMYLTYSRAALLSLYGLAVVIAWRLHRALGLAVFTVGIVVGLLLLPTYLQLRSQAGSAGASQPGSLLVATDFQRITGWRAAVEMWRDEPLMGQGFLSYKQLADHYGDPVLSSPHNEWLRLFAEEGLVAGVLGLGFVASTLSWLGHVRGALAAGILAGTIGYFMMASFNNPFLYIQISAVVYPLIGYALVMGSRASDADSSSTNQPGSRALDGSGS